MLLQLVQPIVELFARNIDYKVTSNHKQITYIKNLAQEVLVMFSTVFKQQLLEVVLEVLLAINSSNESLYNAFCDRLEGEMLPYIISHSEEGQN